MDTITTLFSLDAVPIRLIVTGSRCKIGDEGARCLADALRSNTCLRELR